MREKIEFSYQEVSGENERRSKITEILSQGVYAYLKKKGLLKDSPGRSQKIKLLLEKAKQISHHEESDHTSEKDT